MKIEIENSIRRLSFLCRLQDIETAWINLCDGDSIIFGLTNIYSVPLTFAECPLLLYLLRMMFRFYYLQEKFYNLVVSNAFNKIFIKYEQIVSRLMQ